MSLLKKSPVRRQPLYIFSYFGGVFLLVALIFFGGLETLNQNYFIPSKTKGLIRAALFLFVVFADR